MDILSTMDLELLVLKAVATFFDPISDVRIAERLSTASLEQRIYFEKEAEARIRRYVGCDNDHFRNDELETFFIKIGIPRESYPWNKRTEAYLMGYFKAEKCGRTFEYQKAIDKGNTVEKSLWQAL